MSYYKISDRELRDLYLEWLDGLPINKQKNFNIIIKFLEYFKIEKIED
jgi:hypothetical protein